MKVAMVSTAKVRGGAARMAFTLANSIREVESSIDLQFYHCEDDEKTEWINGIKKSFSRELNAVLARLGGARFIYDRAVANQIIEETQDADILHIHNLHGYYLNYEKLLEAWKDRPVVWTWHDMWGATGRCGFSFDCNIWETGCVRCPHKDYYPSAWLDFAGKEFISKTHLYSNLSNIVIVSPSQWLADIAIKRNFERSSVMVIPNPVDIKAYRPIEMIEAKNLLGLEKSKKYILYVAADCNDERKGYEDYLAVIEKSKSNGLVVGKPPKEQSGKIIYAGSVSSAEELSKYYSAAEVMIITSKQDNYPNTVIESMACGTPVFGYAAGGISSQIPEFLDGTVPVGDVDGLVKRLSDYLALGGKDIHLQRKLRTHIELGSSPESVSKRYIELYRKISC